MSPTYLRTVTGQTADIPPQVVEEVMRLSAKHRVDLNTCQRDGSTYFIGEPRTGLTIRATRNGAKFGR